MKIVFFGTDEFAKDILAALLERGFPVVAAVTKPDKPKGRGHQLLPPPVKEFLESKGWARPIYQPLRASAPEFIDVMRDESPDLFIVASYGEIMKQELLDVPALGCINVHPSLLPKYRGPSPIQSAVLAGDEEVGVTIMEMVLALDAGGVIAVAKMPLAHEMTFGEAEKALAQLAIEPLSQAIFEIESVGKVESVPQDESRVTYTKKFMTQDGVIDWNGDVKQVYNFIRGMNPRPGASTMIEVNGVKLPLKIFRASIVEGQGGAPGSTQVFGSKQGWIVSCKDGWLSLLEVQPEGKRKMSIQDFINGFPKAQIAKS